MKTKRDKTKYYELTLELLAELKGTYPSYGLGKHLSTALDDYGDIWGLSDKEIHFALTKYKAQMTMDVPRETDEEEINRIIKDGLNLSLDMDDDEYL